MLSFACGTAQGSLVWFGKEQAVPAFSAPCLGVREGRVMTKTLGPEDLSSSSCQVLVCCQEMLLRPS